MKGVVGVAAAVAAVGVLAGCGGGGEALRAPGLARLACPGQVHVIKELELFVQSEAACGSTVVYTFASSDQRGQWAGYARDVVGSVRLGGSHGAAWAVAGDDAAEVSRVAGALK